MQVMDIIDNQWETLHNDLYAAAYLLNPRYHHLVRELVQDAELKSGLKAVLKRMLPNAAAAARALDEFFSIYVPGARSFDDEMFREAAARVTVAPQQVWEQYGESTPTLTPVAMKVNAAWCSAGKCERNWKDHAHTHTKDRNRLSKKRVEKLVSVKANSRARERAKVLPEAEYNWVGSLPDGEEVEEDDSDGEEVDISLVDSGQGMFAGNDDETLDWELEELDPSVLDANAASCFAE